MQFIDEMPKKNGRGRKRDPRFDKAIEAIMTGVPCRFIKEDDFPKSTRASFVSTLKKRADEEGVRITTQTRVDEPDVLYAVLVKNQSTKKKNKEE